MSPCAHFSLACRRALADFWINLGGADTVLNIRASLQVSNTANKKGTGYIATDSIDAKLAQVCRFRKTQSDEKLRLWVDFQLPMADVQEVECGCLLCVRPL